MKKLSFRKMIQWLGLLALAHLVGMIFFGVALSSSIAHMAEEIPVRAVRTLLWYGIIFNAIFFGYMARGDMQYTEFQKAMREDVRAGRFSLRQYFYIKEYAVKMGIAMALQIPFVIFFAIFGMPLQFTPLFAQFYAIDAGCYVLTGSAILGWILNGLLFSAIYALVKVVLLLWKKRQILRDYD